MRGSPFTRWHLHGGQPGRAPRHIGERPCAALLHVQLGRRGREPPRDARADDQTGAPLAKLIQEGEGHLGWGLTEHLLYRAEDARDVLAERRSHRQLPDQREPPRADHLPRRLHHDDEDAADLGGLVPDREVRERVVTILEEPEPLERDEKVLEVNGCAGGEHALHQRSQDGPSLFQGYLDALPEVVGVLRADDGQAGFVVQHGLLGAPEDEAGLGRSEHHAHRRAERLRPACDGAERGLGPALRAHHGGQLAAAREDLRDVVPLRIERHEGVPHAPSTTFRGQ